MFICWALSYCCHQKMHFWRDQQKVQRQVRVQSGPKVMHCLKPAERILQVKVQQMGSIAKNMQTLNISVEFWCLVFHHQSDTAAKLRATVTPKIDICF